MISKDEVRKLYAAASQYDPKHLRHDLNAAEFDWWLERNDAAVAAEALNDLQRALREVRLSQSGEQTAEPIFNLIQARVDAAKAEAVSFE